MEKGKTSIWGFPKIRVTLLGVPIRRIIVFCIFGSILGSPYLGQLTYVLPLGGYIGPNG